MESKDEPAKKRMRLCHVEWWQRLGITRCWWAYKRFQNLFGKIYGIKFCQQLHGVDKFVFRHMLTYLDLAENFDKDRDAQRKIEDY